MSLKQFHGLLVTRLDAVRSNEERQIEIGMRQQPRVLFFAGESGLQSSNGLLNVTQRKVG